LSTVKPVEKKISYNLDYYLKNIERFLIKQIKIEHISVISGAQSGEFISVKGIGIKDYDLLVEKFYLIHNKKGLCAENAEANSERNLYAPPLGLV